MRGLRRCAERHLPTWHEPSGSERQAVGNQAIFHRFQRGAGGVQFFFKPGGSNERGAFGVCLFKGRVILHAVKEFGNGAVGIDNAVVGNEFLFDGLLSGFDFLHAGFGDHIGPLELVCSSFHVHSPFLRRQWTAAAIISFTMATTIRKIPSFASMVDSSEEKVYSMGGR